VDLDDRIGACPGGEPAGGDDRGPGQLALLA